MGRILFISAFCMVGGLVIATDQGLSPKVATKPPRDHITCWQNHAVVDLPIVDLPIVIPSHYSEQATEELRAIVCEEYFGFSPVVTPPSDL